jgi:hypothetical protein
MLEKQEKITFLAQREGYKTYSSYATLVDTELRFPVERSE